MSTDVRRTVYAQISGHRALDVVNTVDWRLSAERRTEDLHDYDDVVGLAVQLGMLREENVEPLRAMAARFPRDASDEVDRVRRLRESLYEVLFGDGDPGVLAREYSDAVDRGTLTRNRSGWAWELPLELSMPRHLIGFEVNDLVTRADLSVLGQCQDAERGWVFLDTSPRHNRRWCVAADCGNRNRARDFYRRSRAE